MSSTEDLQEIHDFLEEYLVNSAMGLKIERISTAKLQDWKNKIGELLDSHTYEHGRSDAFEEISNIKEKLRDIVEEMETENV